jgi:hypothetical protein
LCGVLTNTMHQLLSSNVDMERHPYAKSKYDA